MQWYTLGKHADLRILQAMKKKDDIAEYVSAHDAAQILSRTHNRPIRVDYVRKMVKGKKYQIRYYKIGGRNLYHRGDIQAATIGPYTSKQAE
jgi:hypothetical protein